MVYLRGFLFYKRLFYLFVDWFNRYLRVNGWIGRRRWNFFVERGFLGEKEIGGFISRICRGIIVSGLRES